MNSRTKKITALLVAGALLTGFGVSQVAQRLSFKDIPAGHWATTAVEYIAGSGLITGFPDGTFRGQQNMTRYEAATVFYRLLKSGALKNVDEEGRALIAKGIGEVKVELDRVRGGFAELERSDASQTSRLGALEGQLRNLSVAPTTNTNAQQVDAMRVLEARLKTLEERGNASDGQEARIKTLEGRVSSLGAVESRVNGLEAQIDVLGKRLGDTNSDFSSRLQTVEAETKTGATQTQNLNSRLTTLEGRVNALGERVGAPAPTPSTSSVPVTVEPAQSAGFYLAGGASYPLAPMPMFDLSRSSYSAMIGVSRVMDLGFTNLGVRVAVDYMPVGGTFTINPALTFSAGGFFDPYLGLGIGFSLGGGDGVFVNALAGFDVNVLSFAALFAELDPRYSFSTGQFGLNTRVGFKIKF